MCQEWHPFAKLKIKKNRLDVKFDIEGLANSLNKKVV